MELKNLYKKVGVKVNDFLYSNGLRPLSIHKEDSRVLVYHGVTKNTKTDINARSASFPCPSSLRLGGPILPTSPTE